MADRFYSLDRGEHEHGVTEGSSTSSEDVEIRVDLTAGMEKNEFLRLIDEIKNYVIKNIWPPA